MKNILYTIALLTLIIYSCNQAAPIKKETVQAEDSVQYYPPTPKTLDKQEFRHYVRLLNSLFESKLLSRNFNGSILIAKDGVPVYEKYVGFADLRTKDIMTDSTPIHIASTSKTFTSVAILRLVQENKLSLDDSIQRFFPGLPYPGITVKMLLSHRSGLPNYLYFMEKANWDKKQQVTNNDVLHVLYTEKPNKTYQAGKRFNYCNTNFVLLATIIEKISGMPFPQFMQKNFFGPLQMKHTFVFTLADMGKVVSSYNYNNTIWDNDYLEGTYGDKNIYSTPKDLLKWDQALYTDQLLRKSLLDTAFTPYSNERPSIHNYGLGFRMLNLPNGKKVIYHFGRWHGFNAAFARLTEEKATIIILGNKFNRNIYSVAHKAYDLFGDYNQNHDDDEDDDSKENKSRLTKGITLNKK
ncbi:MAG: serine hydrolase domain-containing protein [Chitinophagaceae bacterium]